MVFKNGGFIYLVAGVTGNSSVLRNIRKYEVETNQWSLVTDIPSDYSDMCYECTVGGFVNNKIYLSGFGYNANVVKYYDMGTGLWTETSMTITFTRNKFTTTLSDKIYTFGGYTGSRDNKLLNSNTCCDPLTNTVTAKANIPINMSNAGCCSHENGNIYVLGGRIATSGEIQGCNKSYIYNTNTDSWTEGVSLPLTLSTASATSDGDFIYLTHGYVDLYDYGADYATNDVYKMNINNNQWEKLAQSLTASYWGSSVVVNKILYKLGGYNGGAKANVEFIPV